jgi:hypothetical protein
MQDWRDPMTVELKSLGVSNSGPIMREMRKPQLMYIPYNNYGLKKLKERLKKDGNAIKNVR